MTPLRPSTDVRPVTEFRANTSAIIDQMHSTKRPVILTQHGRSAAVLLDPEVYESLIDDLEMLRSLAVSETQVSTGAVISHEDVKHRIREKYSL